MHFSMQLIGPELVCRYGDLNAIADMIAAALLSNVECPFRQHYSIRRSGLADATLLTMPAWSADGYIVVKVAAVLPGNSEQGKPSVSSHVLLMSVVDGEMLALIDGGELTVRRTAAASLLASRFLSRSDSRTMTMLGTGRLAKPLVRAHIAARKGLDRVWIWGRNYDRARRVANELTKEGVPAVATSDIETAVGMSDIVSSATLSREPLIQGKWLRTGTHVDLVGGFTPEMREADDECIRRARVFCDFRTAASREAGDLSQPLAAGLLQQSNIVDLKQLCSSDHTGRETSEEITLFKSVGFATEDLAAAVLVYRGVTSTGDADRG